MPLTVTLIGKGCPVKPLASTIVWQRRALATVVIASTLLRCVHLGVPLLDGMAVKQIYIAHKARGIAGPPFSLLHNSFDFLDENGQRTILTEEIPLYTGLLAGAYRLFGEHEWLGRLLSILASGVAVMALHDLVRREMGRALALPATMFFALSPLLLVYGQAVQPDMCMLAGMLVACAAYSRFLARRTLRWWLTAAVAGAFAALFKYYGLMVVVPLAFMTFRAAGARRRTWLGFMLLVTSTIAPVAIWMIAVFLYSPNPSRGAVYFLFQMPELLWEKVLYFRFVDRFLYKDLGPGTCAFLVVGVASAALGKLDHTVWPIVGWTVTGLGFYFMLGPLLRCHDYYELMLLPAASVWAASGWNYLYRCLAREPAGYSRRWHGTLASWLVALSLLHSPWVMHGKFKWDHGLALAGQRLDELASRSGRVVVIGPAGAASVVHYSRREGWVAFDAATPTAWRDRLARYRDLGAEYAVIYINPELSTADRHRFTDLATELGPAEHHAGAWLSDGRISEYYVVKLTTRADVARRR